MSHPVIPKNNQLVEQLRSLASIEKDPAKLIALFTEINSLVRKKEGRLRPLRGLPFEKPRRIRKRQG
jgi:hypothetical protein